MRHRVAGRRLNRSMGHRNALRRNLITELYRHERLETTKAKAQAIRGDLDAARNAPTLAEITDTDPTIIQWRGING